MQDHVVRASIWFASALGIIGMGAVLLLSPVPSWLGPIGWVFLFIGSMAMGVTASIYWGYDKPRPPKPVATQKAIAPAAPSAPVYANVKPVMTRVVAAYRTPNGFIDTSDGGKGWRYYPAHVLVLRNEPIAGQAISAAAMRVGATLTFAAQGGGHVIQVPCAMWLGNGSREDFGVGVTQELVILVADGTQFYAVEYRRHSNSVPPPFYTQLSKHAYDVTVHLFDDIGSSSDIRMELSLATPKPTLSLVSG